MSEKAVNSVLTQFVIENAELKIIIEQLKEENARLSKNKEGE